VNNDFASIVKLLLDAGADTSTVDIKRRTPIQLAKSDAVYKMLGPSFIAYSMA